MPPSFRIYRLKCSMHLSFPDECHMFWSSHPPHPAQIYTGSVSEIPVIVGYGSASLCDKFPTFGDSVFVSKHGTSIIKLHGDTSLKEGNVDCTTVKTWKLASSFFLCNVLHLPFTSTHLDPSVLFSTLNTCSSLRMPDRLFWTVRWFISHIRKLMSLSSLVKKDSGMSTTQQTKASVRT